MSCYTKCGERCEGARTTRWLRSGEVMYFNDAWNRSWTHGVPPHDVDADGPCGPRISVALLCAERGDPMLCPLSFPGKRGVGLRVEVSAAES